MSIYTSINIPHDAAIGCQVRPAVNDCPEYINLRIGGKVPDEVAISMSPEQARNVIESIQQALDGMKNQEQEQTA